jgi:DNA repair protein RadA/Sms
VDLPIALALASSLRDVAIPSGTVAIGEVGLLGELRSVGGLDRRLREAARLGFGRAIIPAAGDRSQPAAPVGLELLRAETLREAIDLAIGRHEPAGPARRPSTIVG